MRKVIAMFALLLAVSSAIAEPRAEATKPANADKPLREIYVPFEDLNVILENDKQRVFLTRAEYDELLKTAKSSAQTPAPQAFALIDAQYVGELREGRALISGALTIEVLAEGLLAIPLPLSGVGIRSAKLDGRAAPLIRPEDAKVPRSFQGPLLLVQGKGLHKLELELTAPLQMAAAQQTLQVRLPMSAATRVQLSAPGNIEVKGGAAVIGRTLEAARGRTVFELQPEHGQLTIVLSLNNRVQQEQRLLVARSVIVDEVTQGYERIHATISCRPIHGSIDKLRLAIPAGFEVTKVESVLLARWEEQQERGTRILVATLREAASEPVVLRLTANRSPASGTDWLASLADWKFPRLEALDTAGHVAVLGLLVEDRLQVQNIATEGLLPIDSAALAAAIPASVLKAEPGAPMVRQVVSFYAPASDYVLSATFVRPPAGLKVATNSLLVIGDEGLTLQGGFSLTPEAEALHRFVFTLPGAWKLTQITAQGGAALPFERYPLPAGGTRISVRLPQEIAIGQSQTVHYHAVLTPGNWLAEWTPQQVDFPKLAVDGAGTQGGAIAVQATDDLAVRAETLRGLTPLFDNEKGLFGFGELPTALAYRVEDQNFVAQLIVERTAPSVTAQVFSFLKLERENLRAHYELNYDVREARTRAVSFALPIGTPTELAIRGLGNTAVKEWRSADQGPLRIWTVQLAGRQMGSVRLAIDFTQRRGEPASENAPLPLVQAENVEHQSGFVAVEGDAELDVRLQASAREVDIGELTAAEYQLGRRVIGTFGYSQPGAVIRAAVTPRDPYALPAALIQRAELLTRVSAAGLAQSVARYDLLTKATLLEIRLPPDSQLWTIYLDDQPTKPQREAASLLISVPPQERLAVRKLQVVFETDAATLGISGNVDAVAPQLLVRAAGSDADREIPQADLVWHLFLPSGYSIRRTGGSVEPDNIEPRELAAMQVLRFLYDLAGGIRPLYLSKGSARISNSFSAVFEASPEAKSATSPQTDYLSADPSATPPPAAEPAVTASGSVAQADGDRRRVLARDLADRNSTLALAEESRTQTAERLSEPAEAKSSSTQLWALEGVSSLKIDLKADAAPAATFRSLGERPRLRAVVIDQRRVRAAAWGSALLALLVGVSFTFRPAREKVRFVIVLMLASTVPLLVISAFDEMALVFDYVFFAACGLVAYYAIAAVLLAVYRRSRSKLAAHYCPPPATQAIATMLLAAGLMLQSSSALAQQAPPEDTTPVAVPADAVIIPYDPEQPHARTLAQKILVPYSKYVELWNRAYPAQAIETAPPAFGYAIAGTSYETRLVATDFLAFTGRMEIDLFSDKPVAVPLSLAGGVLERATVDGQPARLQVVEPAAGATAPVGNALRGVPPATEGVPQRLFLLHLAGKGRHVVQLNIRLGLARQGGWRIVRGQLPAGPATALTLLAPEAGTEIRQQGLADRATFDTKEANERIEVAISAEGVLHLQWRPKVSEGMVDQALTGNSLAVFDVREDSLRLTWQVRLDFGRAYRDAFSLTAPSDYLVEQVTGNNIRAWSAKREGDAQRIDVTLLKPAQGRETLTLHLSRRGRVGKGELAEFDVPAVLVTDAVLEQGEIAIRKSPRLDLRTLSATGLSRADSGGQTAAIESLADGADAAVLVVRPFQAFRFVRPPFLLSLVASELPANATAEVRAALRIAEREWALDAAITFKPKGQPLYRVQFFLPTDFTLDRLGPSDLEWSITSENGRQLVTVLLLDGRTSDFTLTLLGKSATATQSVGEGTARTLAAPKIEILDVEKQEGEIVILPGPDTDVRLDALRNCESSPLTAAPPWLKADQKPLAKAVLRYRTADYSATINLTPRTPLVSVRTITNVKLTSRSIEETILLNFRIDQAGIRRVAFLVPQHLAKARLKARLLQQKTVEPATDAGGQPITGMIRFTLELQDFVRGEYAVLLEHDRLLTAEQQTISLPIAETGRTDRRLLAIENASRDEIAIDPKSITGLEPLSRQQQAWRELAAVLGDNLTQVYAATGAAAEPTLTFHTVQRQQARLAGARIGLATTLLVVDSSGAYRAVVHYRMTNATEPFLELALPAGARLWTALVAGEPVKPAETTPPRAGVVRIPLVKTAEGEGDYLVELKYGGRMQTLGGFGHINFPLIRETNIHAELSQVRLLLPESRRWFDFGGTLRLVREERELSEGFQSYLNKRIQEASQGLASASDYTKVRAAVNLKQSRALLENNRQANEGRLGAAGLDASNEMLLEQAEQSGQAQLAQERAAQADHRWRLNGYFDQQELKRSQNVVTDLGSNFDIASPDSGKAKDGAAFNSAWFAQNQLAVEQQPRSDLKAKKASAGGLQAGGAGAAQSSSSRYFRGRQPGEDAQALAPGQKPADKPQLPEIAAKKELEELQLKLRTEVETEQLARQPRGERAEQLQRYQENLEMNLDDRLAGSPEGGNAFGGQVPRGYGLGGGQSEGKLRGAIVPLANAPAGMPTAPRDPFAASDAAAAVELADGERYAQLAAGLASLDVELPERGRLYRFTTPRGDIAITARSISQGTLARLANLAMLAGLFFVAWLLSRPAVWPFWKQLADSTAIGILLAILGLASLLLGVLPFAGLAAIVAGLLIATRSRLRMATV